MCGVTWYPSIEDNPMLSDVMTHFGLTKSLRHVDYFETEHHRQLLKDLKAAIHEGGIVALTGVVGSGKTVLLWRIQDQLRHEGQIEVSESLVFDVPRVTLNTLKLALYYDLATDKDGDLTGKPEKSERALLKVMQRCQKPIALFIDDGHDLHGQTLRSLKQFIEKTSHRGSRLTVVLAGHPRLKHELRRPSREEIGARTTVFELEGIQGQQRRYITWLLERCAASVDPMEIVTPEALELLAERLITPLQRIFQENRDRFWWVTCCKLIMFALRNQRLSCGYLYVPPRNNIRQSDGSLGQQLLAEWARLWDSLNAEVVSDTDLDGTD